MSGLALFGWLCILALTLWLTVVTVLSWWHSWAFNRTDGLPIVLLGAAAGAWFLCLSLAPFDIVWTGI